MLITFWHRAVSREPVNCDPWAAWDPLPSPDSTRRQLPNGLLDEPALGPTNGLHHKGVPTLLHETYERRLSAHACTPAQHCSGLTLMRQPAGSRCLQQNGKNLSSFLRRLGHAGQAAAVEPAGVLEEAGHAGQAHSGLPGPVLTLFNFAVVRSQPFRVGVPSRSIHHYQRTSGCCENCVNVYSLFRER